MSQTITLPGNVVQNILVSLKTLQKDVAIIKARINAVPSYGSLAWWTLSDARAKSDIANKRLTTLKNEKDIDNYFDSL